jgi:hypothetical protein
MNQAIAARAAIAIAGLSMSACTSALSSRPSLGANPVVLQPFVTKQMRRADADLYACPLGYTLVCAGSYWTLRCFCGPR